MPTVALLVLQVSPFQLGLLTTVGTVGYPLLGLVAGVWIDRAQRRKVLIAADLVRFLAMASLPVAAVLGGLGFVQMIVVAAITGGAAIFFDVGYQAYLPSLVEPEQIARSNARMEISASTAQVAGPPVAGFLVQVAGAANAILVDAASYLASVLALVTIREPERLPDRPRRSLFAEARRGIRIVIRHRLLFRLVLATAAANLGRGLAMELFLLYAYRGLGFTPTTASTILATGAIATLVGAASCNRIVGRFGLGRAMLVSSAVKGLPWLAAPLALVWAPFPVMVVISVVSGFFLPIWNVNSVSLRQYLTDASLLGRVSATARTISWATIPLAALLGGVLAQLAVSYLGNRLGLALVLVFGGLAWSAATLLLPSSLRTVDSPRDAAELYGRVSEGTGC